uniref:Uncharacterized protein n=1 Tax=Aegilops tauschii TaxID=37682 RepID=R7WCM4_AEGTA
MAQEEAGEGVTSYLTGRTKPDQVRRDNVDGGLRTRARPLLLPLAPQIRQDDGDGGVAAGPVLLLQRRGQAVKEEGTAEARAWLGEREEKWLHIMDVLSCSPVVIATSLSFRVGAVWASSSPGRTSVARWDVAARGEGRAEARAR